MMRFTDYEKWKDAAETRWPCAQYFDQRNPRGIASFIDPKLPAAQREVARWVKTEQRGWVVEQ